MSLRLTATRTTPRHALAFLCRDDREEASTVLGLAAGQRDLVGRNAGSRRRRYRPGRRDLHRRALRRPRPRHPLPRGAAARPRGRRHQPPSAVRPGDRIPPVRLSATPASPASSRSRAGRDVLGEAVRDAMGTGLLVDPFPLRDVRRVLAAEVRPGPPGGDDGAASCTSPPAAYGGEPLQQGDQGRNSRPARGRRQPRHAAGPRRDADPPRLDRRVGERTARGTQLDVVVTQVGRVHEAVSRAIGHAPAARRSSTGPAARLRSSALRCTHPEHANHHRTSHTHD